MSTKYSKISLTKRYLQSQSPICSRKLPSTPIDTWGYSARPSQISNFEKKLEALVDIYGDKVMWGFFYFIDPSLIKNRNFYQPELQKLQESWGVHLSVSYGQDMFNQLGLSRIWPDIMNNLQKWRQDIPDLPNVNFDSNPEESAEEIKDLPLRIFRKLFDDERIVSQILPVLFPSGATLAILEPYFRAQNMTVTDKIADSINLYMQAVYLTRQASVLN